MKAVQKTKKKTHKKRLETWLIELKAQVRDWEEICATEQQMTMHQDNHKTKLAGKREVVSLEQRMKKIKIRVGRKIFVKS